MNSRGSTGRFRGKFLITWTSVLRQPTARATSANLFGAASLGCGGIGSLIFASFANYNKSGWWCWWWRGGIDARFMKVRLSPGRGNGEKSPQSITPCRVSRHDVRLARQLWERDIPLTTAETALLLASLRRAARRPDAIPLGGADSLAALLFTRDRRVAPGALHYGDAYLAYLRSEIPPRPAAAL